MVYTRRRSIGRLLHEKRKITRPKMLKILVLTSKNITYLIIKRFQLMVRKEISSFNLNQGSNFFDFFQTICNKQENVYQTNVKKYHNNKCSLFFY